MFDLGEKRALVVGGTGVLGGRFCMALAAAGAEVVLAGRSRERGEQLVRDVQSAGGSAWFIELDATDRASVQLAAAECAKRGGIDILVNAPGINSSTPFEELTDEEWSKVLDTNLGSMFRTIQAFQPQLAAAGNGSIINISSTSAGPPLSRVLAYGVSKAGVNNLTQYLARELAPQQIRVNAIVPGFFPAEQNRALLSQERISDIVRHTPMGRLGELHELDGALLWLASGNASGFVTGALIRVDGGFSAMSI
ncbi:MAG: gluconate 5-dehydrogenase [Leifsonia xyli]|nr:MAG: gluconate 5-dehydrogenase [Leifsonia xyli]